MQPSDLFNSIDLNGIPASLISSTEIITGGASAIYGSDALAGVINFQLRKNFSGIELDAQQGITDEGDGANFNISATVGTNFADGRGNIVLSASYLDRKDIFPQTSRKFFREYQPLRSEEHTSELQSLMRISYAVFCLKKKNKKI